MSRFSMIMPSEPTATAAIETSHDIAMDNTA